FDLVVLANDPMAHLTSRSERVEVFERLARHVAPGGHLAVEGLHRPLGDRPSLVTRHAGRETGPFTVEERWTREGCDATWTAMYRFTEGARVVEVESRLAAWTFDDVEGLRRAGLRIVGVLGDFDERPFTDGAPRMIVIAAKDG